MILSILVLLVPAGCSRSNPADEFRRYVPTSAEARRALELALNAWANPVTASNSRTIQFIDQQRLPGQRLRKFQILGESDISVARQFTVRLDLEQAEEPVLVRYNVFGQSPVWVYRLEDYELISHWEHKMDEPEDRRGAPRVTEPQPRSGSEP